MVTTKLVKSETFTVKIDHLHDDSVLVEIIRTDGHSKSYRLNGKKIRTFAAIDATVKELVEFTVGRV